LKREENRKKKKPFALWLRKSNLQDVDGGVAGITTESILEQMILLSDLIISPKTEYTGNNLSETGIWATSCVKKQC
jgi:hypothetical protein